MILPQTDPRRFKGVERDKRVNSNKKRRLPQVDLYFRDAFPESFLILYVEIFSFPRCLLNAGTLNVATLAGMVARRRWLAIEKFYVGQDS
jgi:hypothetical protein